MEDGFRALLDVVVTVRPEIGDGSCSESSATRSDTVEEAGSGRHVVDGSPSPGNDEMRTLMMEAMTTGPDDCAHKA